MLEFPRNLPHPSTKFLFIPPSLQGPGLGHLPLRESCQTSWPKALGPSRLSANHSHSETPAHLAWPSIFWREPQQDPPLVGQIFGKSEGNFWGIPEKWAKLQLAKFMLTQRNPKINAKVTQSTHDLHLEFRSQCLQEPAPQPRLPNRQKQLSWPLQELRPVAGTCVQFRQQQFVHL